MLSIVVIVGRVPALDGIVPSPMCKMYNTPSVGSRGPRTGGHGVARVDSDHAECLPVISLSKVTLDYYLEYLKR